MVTTFLIFFSTFTYNTINHSLFMTLPLKNIPEDIKDYILLIQQKTKVEKGTLQYSQPLTIFKIIREHKQISELNQKAKHNF